MHAIATPYPFDLLRLPSALSWTLFSAIGTCCPLSSHWCSAFLGVLMLAPGVEATFP